jgi:response regulator of citrate/malate metabolism
MLGSLRTSGEDRLPKGLAPDLLEGVVSALRDGGALSAAEVAERLGVSRVTARRYLEHLTAERLADREPRYGGAGRPELEYRWRT